MSHNSNKTPCKFNPLCKCIFNKFCPSLYNGLIATNYEFPKGLPGKSDKTGVFARSNVPIGGGCCTPTLNLMSRNDHGDGNGVDEEQFGKIIGPMCFGGLLGLCYATKFEIFEDGRSLGNIKKFASTDESTIDWEIEDKSDKFSLDFTRGLGAMTPQQKAMIIGEVVHLDILFLESDLEIFTCHQCELQNWPLMMCCGPCFFFKLCSTCITNTINTNCFFIFFNLFSISPGPCWGDCTTLLCNIYCCGIVRPCYYGPTGKTQPSPESMMENLSGTLEEAMKSAVVGAVAGAVAGAVEDQVNGGGNGGNEERRKREQEFIEFQKKTPDWAKKEKEK